MIGHRPDDLPGKKKTVLYIYHLQGQSFLFHDRVPLTLQQNKLTHQFPFNNAKQTKRQLTGFSR